MTRRMTSARGSGGFTLVEVLVALAIVTMGMAVMLVALSSSANTTAYLRDKTFAEWVALNQIANLRLKGQVPATGNSDGDTDDFAGQKWHWRQEVVATEVKGIVRIDVKVRPADIKAGDDNGWFVTVTGLSGDAVTTTIADGQPSWGLSLPGQTGAGGTQNSGAGTAGDLSPGNQSSGATGISPTGDQSTGPQRPQPQSPTGSSQ